MKYTNISKVEEIRSILAKEIKLPDTIWNFGTIRQFADTRD